ncbi:MAG: hypothetical protein HFF49_10580 [Lawsonibacter sp.]|jgi:hypothetical protein|nr:hypothetical protein [Lawsonibacter sp.]
MPTKRTPNYNLSQWERDDRVLMEDFNADNAKIDAAIKAHADALAGLTAAAPKLGNCQVYHGSYIGTETYGASGQNTLTFPYPPMLVCIMAPSSKLGVFVRDSLRPRVTDDPSSLLSTWKGNTLSWYGRDTTNQLNQRGEVYYWVALCSKG